MAGLGQRRGREARLEGPWEPEGRGDVLAHRGPTGRWEVEDWLLGPHRQGLSPLLSQELCQINDPI